LLVVCECTAVDDHFAVKTLDLDEVCKHDQQAALVAHHPQDSLLLRVNVNEEFVHLARVGVYGQLVQVVQIFVHVVELVPESEVFESFGRGAHFEGLDQYGGLDLLVVALHFDGALPAVH